MNAPHAAPPPDPALPPSAAPRPLPPWPGPPAQALVLAAGRGQRMRPLTDHTPKPLLAVRGQPLLVWALQALARAGVQRAVVNTAWLGANISSYFGHCGTENGALLLSKSEFEIPLTTPGQAPADRATASPNRLQLAFSMEGDDFGHALETAGGICRALPWLDEVFWVMAGDIFAPDFAPTPADLHRFAASGKLAHLWLVPNPPHNPAGDFGIAWPQDRGRTAKAAELDGHVSRGERSGGNGSGSGNCNTTAANQAFSAATGHTHPPSPCAPAAANATPAGLARSTPSMAAASPLQAEAADAPIGLALNPAANPASPSAAPIYTFSTFALYRRALFEPPWCDIPPGNPHGQTAPLAPLLRRAIAAGQVSAQLYHGAWADIGTPERLAQVNAAGH